MSFGKIISSFLVNCPVPAHAWDSRIKEVFGELHAAPGTLVPVFFDTDDQTESVGFAICGRIGSGKSTGAAVLEAHGYKVVSFADPLKDIVAYVFDLPRGLLQGDTSESRAWRETPIPGTHMTDIVAAAVSPGNQGASLTPRFILQAFGTEVARHLYTNVWVEEAMRRCRVGKFVIPDARFPNEIAAARAAGFRVVRVTRDALHATSHAHSSETSIDEEIADLTIDNTGSLATLESRAHSLAR